MKKINLSADQFTRLFQTHGSSYLAELLDVDIRTVQRYRKKVEEELGSNLIPAEAYLPERAARAEISIPNGVVMIGSDGHYWNGKPSTAHRGFVKMIKTIKPDIVIYNGDVIDASTISHYPPIGWEEHPPLSQELRSSQERLYEIETAANGADLIWTLGNHDARYETRLALKVPEYKGIKGIHLKDHFPKWKPAWSAQLNQNTMIKHRFKGGEHAAWNNVLRSGMNMFTGHTHRLLVRPLKTYKDMLYGVETGMLNNPLGGQFTGYTEDNPLNWQEGFVVATYKNWRLLWPEVVPVTANGKIYFRGKEMEV